MPDRPRILGRRQPVTRKGGSATLRDQTRAYRRLCAAILDADPLCRYCRADGRVTGAAVIDHIIALSLGGSNDATNLAPACVECNAAKGQAEQRFVARGYDVADIMRDPDLAGWIRRANRIPFS